jgi:hypothetical protein
VCRKFLQAGRQDPFASSLGIPHPDPDGRGRAIRPGRDTVWRTPRGLAIRSL